MTEAAPIGDAGPRLMHERSWLARLRYTPLRDVFRGHITGRLDLAYEIDQARMPAPIPALVQDVVKRTRLWRGEKADVVRELLAHFRDGLETGATPAELAGWFGDATRAAKLIRRAKKRNRPLLWRALRNTVRAVAAIVGVIMALYLALAARFLIGRPNPAVDYRVHINAAASSVPPRDRAWPTYREALVQLGTPPEQSSGADDFTRRPRPGEEGWEVFDHYLTNHAAPLALARKAAAMPGLGFMADYRIHYDDAKLWPEQYARTQSQSEDDGLYSILLPHLAALRTLARTLQVDAERAAAASDGDAVVADLKAMLGVARHTRESPFIIGDLVALSVFNLMLQTTGDVLASWPKALSDAHLQELAHRIAACDAFLSVRLTSERHGFEDALQRIFTDDGRGDGRIPFRGYRTLVKLTSITASVGSSDDKGVMAFTSPAACAVMLGRQDTLREYDRLINMAAGEAQIPLWLRAESPFEREIRNMQASPIESVRKRLIVTLMPALGRTSIEPELSKTGRDGVLVAIAAELHRRRTGAWPASIADLVPTLLPAVPIDRLDGKPLRYALRDSRPLIYSAGCDGDDDGGAEPGAAYGSAKTQYARRWFPPGQANSRPDGDWVIWPPTIEPRYRLNADE